LERRAVRISCSHKKDRQGHCKRLLAEVWEIPPALRERFGGVLLVVQSGDSSTPPYHIVPADFSGWVPPGLLTCPKHAPTRWPPGAGYRGVPLPLACSTLRASYQRFLRRGEDAQAEVLLWPYYKGAVLP
jgi:hypothetical protein